MTDPTSPISDNDPTKKINPPSEKKPPSDTHEYTTDNNELKYLGYSFNSPQAYNNFKTKFLAQMANDMIREMKRENDRAVEALRKMREDNQ